VVQQEVWQELARQGATIATVAFSGRAGSGGKLGTVDLCGRDGRQRLDARGEALGFALAAPVWDRFGGFAGQPLVRGAVTWNLADRNIVIAGKRGSDSFEEVVS
jgi:hypothetical protein